MLTPSWLTIEEQYPCRPAAAAAGSTIRVWQIRAVLWGLYIVNLVGAWDGSLDHTTTNTSLYRCLLLEVWSLILKHNTAVLWVWFGQTARTQQSAVHTHECLLSVVVGMGPCTTCVTQVLLIVGLRNNNDARPGERSDRRCFMPIGQKRPVHPGVRTGWEYLINPSVCLSVCQCVCLSISVYVCLSLLLEGLRNNNETRPGERSDRRRMPIGQKRLFIPGWAQGGIV